MKEFLEKISSYNIFNYLLSGCIFSGLCDKLTSYSLLQNNILIGLFLYYFIGLIISKVGSLTLQPILKMAKFVNFAPYEDYVNASKLDPMIELLSEQNDMYLSFCILSIGLILLKIFDVIWGSKSLDNITAIFIFLAGLFILFLFS